MIRNIILTSIHLYLFIMTYISSLPIYALKISISIICWKEYPYIIHLFPCSFVFKASESEIAQHQEDLKFLEQEAERMQKDGNFRTETVLQNLDQMQLRY